MNRLSIPVDKLDSKHLFAYSFLAISAVLTIVVLVPRPDAYEFSLYESLPVIIWVLLISSQISNILAFSIASKKRGWIKGIIAVSLIPTTVIIIPHLRGYYLFFTGDSLYHIGVVREIVNQGQLQGGNIYPIVQVLASFVVKVTGLEVRQSAILITIAVSITFIVTGVVLSLRLPLSYRGSLLTAGIITTLLIGNMFYTFAPWAMSQYLYICLFLWVVFSELLSTNRGKFIAIILLITSAPIHPLTSLTLLILLFLATVVVIAPNGSSTFSSSKPIIFLLFIGGISFLIWIMSVNRFALYLNRSFISILFPDAGVWTSTYAENSAASSNANIEKLTIVELFVFRYGKPVLLIGTSLLLIFVHYLKDGVDDRFRTWVVYPLFAFWLLGTTSVLLPLPAIGVARLYAVALLFALLVIGYSLSETAVSRDKIPRLISIAVIFVLLAAIFISTITFYESKGTKIPNQQITKSEVSATEWSLQYIQGKKLFSRGNKIERIATYRGGKNPGTVATRPPPHFNWESVSDDSKRQDHGYLVVFPQDKQINRKFYPNSKDSWRYKPKDFRQLGRDKSTNQVYSSGGINIYRMGFNRYSNHSTSASVEPARTISINN